ncbi:hypothetical protein SNE40_019483 [Patella caerulea]|uniref:Forkhead box protein O n=2 Tax=Patellogastropoda TaxID=69675 RepID=A0AAN8J6K4_PATCE
MDVADNIDPNFEPQIRARSNTWPLRPNREILDAQNSPVSEESGDLSVKETKDPLGLNTKKSGSRRNAWGNLSYADLITKAIQSTPEKRLTLSQVYDWMVQNVPYFKDKGDSTSSAGWKNSIRHNLSLHSRFMRIQNEGTGKSSWWVINPDAKPGKTPRRRAGSMETKSYEKKRGRIKKKVEALRAALENSNSPTSTTEDFLDPAYPFSLSDFRPRASSNASSCGGRLSPIQAGLESDLHDNQVPPMSPIPWATEIENGFGYNSGDGFTDQLVDSLVDGMKLGDTGGLNLADSMDMSDQFLPNNSNSGDINLPDFNQNTNFNSSNFDNQFNTLPAPPPYPDRTNVLTNLDRSPVTNGNTFMQRATPPVYRRQDLFQENGLSPNVNGHSPLTVTTQQLNSPVRSPAQGSPQSFPNRLSPLHPLPNQNCQGSPQARQISPQGRQLSPQHIGGVVGNGGPSARTLTALQQHLQQSNNDSILRAALTQGPAGYQQPTTSSNNTQQFQQSFANTVNAFPNMNGQVTSINANMMNHGVTRQGQQQLLSEQDLMQGDYNQVPQQQTGNTGHGHPGNPNAGLDIDIDSLIAGLDYDVDSLIKQELTLEGNLDFNFDSGSQPGGRGTVR